MSVECLRYPFVSGRHGLCADNDGQPFGRKFVQAAYVVFLVEPEIVHDNHVCAVVVHLVDTFLYQVFGVGWHLGQPACNDSPCMVSSACYKNRSFFFSVQFQYFRPVNFLV